MNIKRLTTSLSITSKFLVPLALLFCSVSPAFAAATIKTDNPSVFVGSIAVAAVGLGGGFALLLLIIGGLKFTLSKGDPTGVAEAQEIITNALAGLALIIFATLILRVIGRDVLNLPGFPEISL